MSNINYLKIVKVSKNGITKNISGAIKIANLYAKSNFLNYTNRVLIEVCEGNYDEINTSKRELEPSEYVDITGVGDREKIVVNIKPDKEQIEKDNFDGRKFEGFFLHHSCKISNLTVVLTDGRYPIHIEPITPKHTFYIELYNVHLIHNGNKNALELNKEFFSSPSALGVGLGNGSELSLVKCIFESLQGQSAGIHNNVGFFKSAKVLIEECKFLTNDSSNHSDLTLKSLNAHTHDQANIINCEFSSGVKVVSYQGCKNFFYNVVGEQPQYKKSLILQSAIR